MDSDSVSSSFLDYTNLISMTLYHRESGRHFLGRKELCWRWKIDGCDPYIPPRDGTTRFSPQCTAEYLIKTITLIIGKRTHYLVTYCKIRTVLRTSKIRKKKSWVLQVKWRSWKRKTKWVEQNKIWDSISRMRFSL